MKRLTVFEPGRAEYENIPTPVPTGNWVLIKVVRTGICATDFAIYTGDCSFVRSGEITYPVRFGHEYSGVVAAVGEDVKNCKVGDRVYTDNAVSCGECEFCKRGEYGLCKHKKSVGTVNCWDGCFSEYMLMPDFHVYHIPDEVSYDDAALIEPASIAYDSFRMIDLNKDSTVVVFGTGAIGMASAWLAKSLGAGKVIMVGRRDAKLAIALQIGCDEVINSTKVDCVKAIKEACNGGADLIIETSGATQAFIDSIYAAKRKTGQIAICSFYEKNVNDIPLDHLVLNRITVFGTAGRFGNPQIVCDIMRKSPYKLTPAISHRVKFDECIDFFENEEKYHNEKIKVMVEFD